jgi:spermidine synthase
METFEELQSWGVTHYYVEKGSHISVKTAKAHVNLFTNPYFGRMLFIDGVLQSSEKDEKLYHQTLVEYAKPTVLKGSVLIAGGAEGATAREVFNGAYAISKVVMVDWDKELVDLMRQEVFCQGVFENPLLEIIHEDIMKYLTVPCDLYDSIIIDLLDPHTEDEIKWLSAVCVLAIKRLKSGGTLVLNAGGNYDIMVRLVHVLEDNCLCRTDYKTIFIPSFQELWYLIRICKI